jgi:DNA-binding NtrC family response regulator
VLPGVTVTAVHEATGNTFLAVSNEQGAFRIPARVGTFRMTLELPGFATITRTGLELLLGQTADLRLQMQVTALQETVTVTAEAPLIDTTHTKSAHASIPLDELERVYVRRVLESRGGNKADAARVLGINRRTLYRKLFGSDVSRPRPSGLE